MPKKSFRFLISSLKMLKRWRKNENYVVTYLRRSHCTRKGISKGFQRLRRRWGKRGKTPISRTTARYFRAPPAPHILSESRKLYKCTLLQTFIAVITLPWICWEKIYKVTSEFSYTVLVFWKPRTRRCTRTCTLIHLGITKCENICQSVINILLNF